jgi:hypothetical protein
MKTPVALTHATTALKMLIISIIFLRVVLLGRETWSLTLIEKHKLQVKFTG